MTSYRRSGVTLLELCVAVMLVGALSSLAAVEFANHQRSQPAGDSLRLAIRSARASALRSGRVVTGTAWYDGAWVEYAALPTGSVLLDSVSAGDATPSSAFGADSVKTR